MKLISRPARSRPYRAAGLLLLFLLLGVLIPCGCVLWFMNEAARSQSDSARRSVMEAYRSQLWFIRDRLETYWTDRAASLLPARSASAPAEFHRIATGHLADSTIMLDATGRVLYPAPAAPPAADPTANRPEWIAAEAMESRHDPLAAAAYERLAKNQNERSLAALAAQGYVRCLVQAGQKDQAVQAIELYFGHARTILAADEQLLALHLLARADRRYPAAVARVASLVNDYSDATLSSAQRLFLADELRAITGDTAPAFPAADAEQLAGQFLAAEKPKAGDRTLEPTHVPGLWKMTAANGRVLALYRTASVIAAMRAPAETAASVRFTLVPPGEPKSAESIPAGPLLPGWSVSFALTDTQPFDAAGRRRVMTYLWVGSLVIAAMAVAGVLAAQLYRRQVRIARLKTDLVAAVSHELKTPLASMRLLVDSLLDDEQFDPAKTREYLVLISRENLRLSRLIENFLTFSRLERNREKFEFHPTDPGEVVRATVEAAGQRFQAPGCVLEVAATPDLPSIQADQDALVTVMLNLLDNAYKYTSGDKRIALRAFHRGSQVIFEVQDNGIGISPREQKRIFRRFYQVDRRLSREAGGCGLGLSIVEFIVKAHGGDVEVKSQPGHGSTFTVRLPAIAAMRAAVA